MMNLIKAELFKIRKEKTFLVVCLGILLVICAAIFGFRDNVCIGIRNVLGTNRINLNSGSNIMFEILKSADILVLLFLPIIISVFMNDFSVGTIKNTIISGYSRSKIYLSKLIVSCIVCLVLVLIYSFTAFLINIIRHGYNGGFSLALIIDTLKVIALQIPIYFGTISIAFMIGILTNKKTLLITVYMLYQVIVLMLFVMFNNRIGDFIKYEPISNLDMAANIGVNSFSTNMQIMIIGLVMIIISLSIGLIRINKIDIK